MSELAVYLLTYTKAPQNYKDATVPAGVCTDVANTNRHQPSVHGVMGQS